MQEQRGARWLAQQQQDSGAASRVDEAPAAHQRGRQAQPRYSLADHMGDRALVEWCEVLAEYGLMPTAVV